MLIVLLIHLALTVAAVMHLVLQRKRPTVQLLWLILIVFLPGLGLFAYILLGTDRMLLAQLKRRVAAEVRDVAEFALQPTEQGRPESTHWQRCCIALERLNRLSTSVGNHIEALPDAATCYPRLAAALRGADAQILMQFYVWRPDRQGRYFQDLLIEACQRGVAVHVLVDEIGSGKTPERFFAPLRAAGGQVSWTTTLYPRRNRWFFNLRNHRKIVIVDGCEAFTGGLNIGDEYSDGFHGHIWHDLHVMVHGPVVRQLAAVWVEDWHFATQERLVLHRAPDDSRQAAGPARVQVIAGGPEREPSITALSMQAVIQAAEFRLRLSTPFLAPDESFIEALELAVARGVTVEVLVSAETDLGLMASTGHAFFPRLLAAGIRVREYAQDIHHAKVVLIDDAWTLVGSINLDQRSFHLNDEVALLIEDAAFNRRIETWLDQRASQAMDWDILTFRRRPLAIRLLEGLLRMFAPML